MVFLDLDVDGTRSPLIDLERTACDIIRCWSGIWIQTVRRLLSPLDPSHDVPI